MPRRPAELIPAVPLYLIPHVLMQRIREVGEELDRIAVKRTARHFYTVSVRTRPVKREYQAVRTHRKRGGGGE